MSNQILSERRAEAVAPAAYSVHPFYPEKSSRLLRLGRRRQKVSGLVCGHRRYEHRALASAGPEGRESPN